MKTRKFRKACVSMVVVLSVILFTSDAFPWGSATHAYIANKIGKDSPLRNLNEIYGAMAADIFNFYPEVLDPKSPYYHLYLQTHYNSLAVWSEGQGATNLGKSLAFGFASHANGQLWPPYANAYAGADYTAHGPGGNDTGYYVIDKATDLWNSLQPLLSAQGIDLDDTIGLSVSHNIIEFAIDIMVVYELSGGRGIGKKLIESALFRSPEFPLLLVKAYAGGLTQRPFRMSYLKAAEMIISAERDFRKTLFAYGQGLVQPTEDDAIHYVASMLAQIGSEMYGITVTPELVAYTIRGAQALCAGDYKDAIHNTVGFVNTQMTSAGISY